MRKPNLGKSSIGAGSGGKRNRPSHAARVRHVTTIAGPQAEALLQLIRGDKLWHIEDKSVPGLAVIEVYADD